ncbi:MAG TPA: DUF3943 domain-containing protein [Steroidobacteraceae bacterium]|nr:DUF3943 domain-containing protein [Steroidobacteraceae bacterium]
MGFLSRALATTSVMGHAAGTLAVGGRVLTLLAASAGAWGAARAADIGSGLAPPSPAPTAFDAPPPSPDSRWGGGDGKSYLAPAYEIPGFELALNRFDHYLIDAHGYESPISDFKANTHRKWVIDNDAFATNQFLHPYQGAVYQNLARSAGLDFWQSSAYTFAGSLLWEMAGETTRPSINDQVASGISGSLLGEPLFRMASLLLESGGPGPPGFWREAGAALISPATGANRLLHGSRFDGVFPSNDPAVFTTVDLGASLSTHFTSNVNVNADLSAPPSEQQYRRNSASAAFKMAYGLPGKPDYSYDRPFDYFDFEVAADTINAIETVFSRGLLVGTDYACGPNLHGIWGLYGSYDYVAPQVFRVSTTSGSLGTTFEWWLAPKIALQGSVLGGIGYGGGGVLHGAGVTRASPFGDGQRDYHYGLTPQGLFAARLMLWDRVAVDSSLRSYYISKVAASESTGTEDITRAETGVTVRIFGLHAVTLEYTESVRNGRYATLPSSHQTLGTVRLSYTLLGDEHMGAVGSNSLSR